MININRLNQNNEYNLGNPNILTKRSGLLMRETHQSTGNVGRIIPTMFHEMLPSENFHGTQTAHIQFLPFVTNLMHEINADLVTYFVPNRIIWEDWEKFITGCDEENDIIDGTLEVNMINFNSIAEMIEKSIPKRINNDETIYINWLKKITSKLQGLEGDYNNTNTPNQPTVHIKKLSPGQTEALINYILVYGQETKKMTQQKITKLFNILFENLSTEQDYNIAYYVLFGDGIYRWVSNDYIKMENNGIMNYIIQYVLAETVIDYIGMGISNLGKAWFYVENNEATPEYITYQNGVYNNIGWDKNVFKMYKENFKINKLPIRAYNKIYNDWIRRLDWEKRTDADNISVLYGNWAEDIYTRGRRFAYRGSVPTVPVTGQIARAWGNITNNTPVDNMRAHDGVISVSDSARQNGFDVIARSETEWKVQDMMSAAAILNYYLANAKIKPRYSNQLLARWGVNIQDSRFQYAQFVTSQRLNINQQGIIQTAPAINGSTEQGNITGQMWSNGTGQIHFRAPEHGYLISYLLIRPSNVYELGVNPLLKHKNKFDYATPEMVDLPDTPIYQNEICQYPAKKTMAWKSIYDEYRTKVNRVTGLIRPSYFGGLGQHTLAKLYREGIHTMNMEVVVKCFPEMERIKQFIDEPDFMFFVGTQIETNLPLPYSTDPRVML